MELVVMADALRRRQPANHSRYPYYWLPDKIAARVPHGYPLAQRLSPTF